MRFNITCEFARWRVLLGRGVRALVHQLTAASNGEHRMPSAHHCELDLVVCVCPADCPRSSADGSEVNVIGNAGPVQLLSGRILLPFCRNNHDTLLSYSDDDGVSWATPTNFTASVMPSPPVRARPSFRCLWSPASRSVSCHDHYPPPSRTHPSPPYLPWLCPSFLH